jgi:GWxTD domain-containing protein
LTCFAVRKIAVLLLVLAALAGTLGCGGGPPRSRTDLTNPFLGPDYSAWLVGPIARLATPEEIQAYLALQDDGQARQFVESFWAKRDTLIDPLRGKTVRQVFEERSAEADRAFSEAGYLGRRTDRGAIFILYGNPTKTDYEVAPIPSDPPLAVWIYDETAPAGLDGKRPANRYRFVRRGDLTVTYTPGRPDPRHRDRQIGDPDIPEIH